MVDKVLKQVRGYELQELIGKGGAGEVYRAYQSLVSREVAIKVILPEFANQPEFIRRFETEAQIVARLEHLHIVPLYDYWREPDGAYLVMRLLRGGNLRNLNVESWELRRFGDMLTQLVSALNLAHQRGVVHRDIKPDNILLDEENNVYLSDFGIAKDLTAPSQDSDPDLFEGSLLYVSPEQLLGKQVTPRTDIYSLGIVLYELLAGKHPFVEDKNRLNVVTKHLNAPIPSLKEHRPELPDALDTVFLQATAKDPADRYPDVLRFAIAFRRALQDRETTTVTIGAEI
ncbi:MAG: serine/threonine protein kinase, partial [Chloroflexi bacterium]|nr:serine/threonine protein kinase [Chloroflexota bacterium]